MLRGYKVAVALLSRKWTARPRYGLPVTEYHDRGVQAGFLSKALTVSTIATIKAVKITPETLLLKRAARGATADTVPVDKAVIAFISCNGHTVGYKSFFPKKKKQGWGNRYIYNYARHLLRFYNGLEKLGKLNSRIRLKLFVKYVTWKPQTYCMLGSRPSSLEWESQRENTLSRTPWLPDSKFHHHPF